MSYQEKRYNLILQLEESGTPHYKAYIDTPTKGLITIGVGFKIKRTGYLKNISLEFLYM
jgi:hypothetical protein